MQAVSGILTFVLFLTSLARMSNSHYLTHLLLALPLNPAVQVDIPPLQGLTLPLRRR